MEVHVVFKDRGRSTAHVGAAVGIVIYCCNAGAFSKGIVSNVNDRTRDGQCDRNGRKVPFPQTVKSMVSNPTMAGVAM